MKKQAIADITTGLCAGKLNCNVLFSVAALKRNKSLVFQSIPLLKNKKMKVGLQFYVSIKQYIEGEALLLPVIVFFKTFPTSKIITLS